MDPLRCGAGEAGAFHPLWKLWKQYELKAFSPAFPLFGTEGEIVMATVISTRPACAAVAGDSRESGGLNSLFGRASLRNPLRPVSRPAQEKRNEVHKPEELA
jgi:hypothetical protein